MTALKQAQHALESDAYPDGMLYRIEAENGTKAAVDQATDGPETAKDVNASEGAYVKNIGLNQGTVEVTLPDEVTNQNYCLNLCYSSSTSGAVNVWVNGEKHTVSYAKTNGSWNYVPETLLLGSFNLKAGDKIKIQDAKEGCFIWADYVYLTKDTKTLTDVIAKAEALNLDNFEDGNAKNAFTKALANAKSVLANENSTQAVTDAKAIDLKKYQDGDVKEAFTNALAEAESALAAKESQTAVNEAASAIAAAEAVDLTDYQDGNVKNAFRAALTNAQSALADVKINTNPVVKQYKISCYLRGGKNAAGNPTVCGTQKIVLKKPVSKIKKASATSRKVTIKKVTGAKGYQISYSTSASFKKSATKTVYAKKRLK